MEENKKDTILEVSKTNNMKIEALQKIIYKDGSKSHYMILEQTKIRITSIQAAKIIYEGIWEEKVMQMDGITIITYKSNQ